MSSKSIKSKIETSGTGQDLAAAGAKLGAAADQAVGAATGAGSRIESLARKGKHRLQETAEKAGHLAKQVATKVIHSAQETLEKGVHRVKEEASKAEHRRDEVLGEAGDKTKKP